MPETCENCGKWLEDWTVTHCSEGCIFDEIKSSKSIHGYSNFDTILDKIKKE